MLIFDLIIYIHVHEHKLKSFLSFLQVLLIVNVASECGYTTTNYKELVLLQEDYESKDFTVLAFPCNQFGEQEPGSDAEIAKFATQEFDINFLLFSKVSVYGENTTELYDYLYETTGNKPSWNFCKYLVDQNGEVVQFFTVKDSFSVIRHSIEYLVNKHADL